MNFTHRIVSVAHRLVSGTHRLVSDTRRLVSGTHRLALHIRYAAGALSMGLVVSSALGLSASGQEINASAAVQADADAAAGAQTGTTATPPTTSVAKRPARKPFRSARLTYSSGDVRVEQATSTANSVAVLNMPLVEGTVISSGSDGQAEIEFEDGSLARLTPNSGLSLLNLSVDSSGNFQTRIALLGGLAYLELRAGTRYLYTVDVGGSVISPVENATIRVNFDEPPASVAVLDGTAHLASAGKSSLDATAGQTVQVDPSSDGGVLIVKSGIAPESWDRWNQDRDEAAEASTSNETDARTNYAGNQGYGWSDLDANGSWYDVPGHGKVWQPDIAANAGDSMDDGATDGAQNAGDDSGFDPYGYGDWAWTPVGYAWASGYGWGWLPYRCGRWSFYPGFGWGWSPDPYCGIYGFGGYGYGGFDFGGGGINIFNAPRTYKRPHRPIPGPGPIHPILHGPHHDGPMPLQPPHRPGGDRVIAGNTVRSLQPTDIGFVSNRGGALGAGLRRDYPVDPKTRTAVTGMVPATHGVPASASYARPVQAFGSAGGANRGSYVRQPAAVAPGQNSVVRPAQNETRPAPVQRQSAPSTPRSSPPPAPASHSAPAAAPSTSSKGK